MAMNLVRTLMPEQDAEIRAKNFEEVTTGYSAEQAILEASRCLQCKKPNCVGGCPVNIDIPAFVKLAAEGRFTEAARKIKESSSLPAICGRVCPQETQCEGLCVLDKKGAAVAIGALEMFVADWERTHEGYAAPKEKAKNGKRVAVIGSGPASLAASGDLIREGFEVTVFEALHELGGVLTYGIPEFRLPKAIVQSEINYLRTAGVVFEKNFVVGKTATIDELLDEDGYDAVFVGTGAGLPVFMNIPGENGVGVYSANEYLTRANLMRAWRDNTTTPIHKPARVVTIGGGNVAMDSARTALRFGATSYIVYRRSLEEMPARKAEVHHAQAEGIIFELLVNPLEILLDEKGIVRGMKCVRMELGEPDATGRRRPKEIAGSEFEIECDAVIIAIGTTPNPLIPATTPGMDVSKHGTIVADENGRTAKPKVYAGGDIVTGAATVILAMGAGKNAVASIKKDLLKD